MKPLFVHAVGGTVAIVACLIIGPRHGRFEKNFNVGTHNIPLSALGVLILWFGWYGVSIDVCIGNSL